MDLSWVKQLADQANQQEVQRQTDQRRVLSQERQLSLATTPMVEKLQLLTQKCAEEFNKYVQYPHLRIVVSRLQKRLVGTINAGDPELSYPEEKCFFHFTRLDWIYAIRGSRGTVEFLELPQTAEGGLSVNIDQVGASPSRQLTAAIDEQSQQLVWKYQGQILGGEQIIDLTQAYIREFIERTGQ